MIASLSLGHATPASPVPVVPLSSIIRDRQGGSNFAVMVIEGNVARARNVTLGPTYGDRLAVTSGVKAGERVIRTGATMVADGETVEVIP
jgi:multidrug efflux pump subunit AcrA (membrane-fusion protein)